MITKTNIIALQGSGAMTPDQVRALHAADAAIVEAVELAENAGISMGMIVAMLHGYTHKKTHEMMYPDD